MVGVVGAKNRCQKTGAVNDAVLTFLHYYRIFGIKIMCYAIPAKLMAINHNTGILDYFGEQRRVLLDAADNYHIGDYVYAQGGIVVSKVSAQEVHAILATWKDMFFALKARDQVAVENIDLQALPANALAILQKANHGHRLTKDEALALMQLHTAEELAVLYEVANAVRHQVHGNASCVHGIIEFSNYCKNSCHYCGIRSERKLPRYRMTPEEIIAIAADAVKKYGFKALVLQSGEDDWYNDTKLDEIVRTIKKMGVLVFLSIGLRDAATYQKLYHAGARAALLRFETANAARFAYLRPHTTLAARLDLLRQLKAMGYIIATGFILGFPEEAAQDVLDNILLTRSLQPEMYSFGPLIPTRGTPLAGSVKKTRDEILRVIAITRLLDRDANILVTTALETLDAEAKRAALLAGANSMMINLTPPAYREQYAIYDNRACKLSAADAIFEVRQLLFSLGRAPTDLSSAL